MRRIQPRLVGRQPELELLGRALAAGLGSSIAIVGEPGIGKTALLAELSRRAEARGWLVLQGRPAEYEQAVPYAALVHALDDYLTATLDSHAGELGKDTTQLLAGIFPAVPNRSRSRGGRPDERFRSYRAVRRLLDVLARDQPLLLVLDDLHWADAATAELTATLVRQPLGRVLLGLAHRPAGVPRALASAIAAAEREGLLTLLSPGPLGPEDVALLVGEQVSECELTRITRESGGNPFYAVQLAAGAGRAATGRLATHLGAPQPVLDSLAGEVEALAPGARALLQGGAVAGDPFELDLAAVAADLEPAVTLPLLDELLALGLVASADAPRWFRFRHPIVRLASVELASEGWRIAAHTRVAHELRLRNAPAAAIAQHVTRSAAYGDLDAVAILVAAAREARLSAPASAAAWLQTALSLLPATPDRAAERRAILTERGAALRAAGELADAHACFEQALETTGAEDAPAERLRLVSECATLDSLLGNGAVARRRLAAEASAMTDATSRVVLLSQLGASGSFDGQYEAGIAQTREAAAAARELGEPALLFCALSASALAAYGVSDVSGARTACDEASGLLDSLGDEELRPYAIAFFHLGQAQMSIGRYRDAVRTLDRGLALTAMTGDGSVASLMEFPLAVALGFVGELARSEEILLGIRERAVTLEHHMLHSGAAGILSWRALTRGDRDQALGYAREAVEAGGSTPIPASGAYATIFLAEVLLERGDADAARAELTADEANVLSAIPSSALARYYEVLARVEIARGKVGAARECAERALLASGEDALPQRRSQALRAQAAALLAAGDAAAAVAPAVNAVSCADECEALIEGAQARVLAGRVLAAAGEAERARTVLEEARDAARACGVLLVADKATRELRQLGVRQPRPARADSNGRPPLIASANGTATLSAREQQVVALVADGRTNREVAAALYLSEKTVETHLARIFRKLGITSRVAVATLAAREP